MSKLRDMKYVKMIAKLTQSGDIMDNACRMILSDVELKLRLLIVVTNKIQKILPPSGPLTTKSAKTHLPPPKSITDSSITPNILLGVPQIHQTLQ